MARSQDTTIGGVSADGSAQGFLGGAARMTTHKIGGVPRAGASGGTQTAPARSTPT